MCIRDRSFSAFAGNTHFIDFDLLIEQGLLTEADLKGVDFGQDPTPVSYTHLLVFVVNGSILHTKERLVRKQIILFNANLKQPSQWKSATQM